MDIRLIRQKWKQKSGRFKRNLLIFIIVIIPISWFYFSLPSAIFNSPLSAVVLSADGQLIGARVAADGQWRFPSSDTIPQRFKDCIVAFEDRYFYYHFGVNPISVLRALSQNYQSEKVVSGGSTLTMQVARLSMRHRNRTVGNKIKEMVRATRLEFSLSKDEILNLWATHAPFGGNVVGIEAAAWRYFNRPASQLSWAETATLAVLPNAPSLIYIGKNQNLLLKKRNRLLDKLLKNGKIDQLTHKLAVAEGLPQQVFPIPDYAPHVIAQLNQGEISEKFVTTIDLKLQNEISELVQPMVENNALSGIGNAAILILDVNSGNVLVYHGNLTAKNRKKESNYFVDIIKSPRSSGSTLKPFLYALAFDRGDILPTSLLVDIPIQIGGYQPQNFDKEYAGLVSASQALATSLNVPAVKLLQSTGLVHFYNLLNQIGFRTINKGADHYGLSLILGGAEVNLWELTGVFASMARVLNHYHMEGYSQKNWHQPIILKNHKETNKPATQNTHLSASAIALTFNSLLDANRPINETGWRLFENNKKIAWKTGTSYGFRDAWSIGITSKYAVGVWVGNADGEGKPNLTGLSVAAPIMFKIFSHLPDNQWFVLPKDEMIKIEICNQSGYKAGSNCTQKSIIYADKQSEKGQLCPYHKELHLDKSMHYQVNSSCENLMDITTKSWFVLPPIIEYYYKIKNPEYKSPPPFRVDCVNFNQDPIDFIYPENGAKLVITNDFTGEPSPIIFKATHQNPKTVLHWHLDSKYLGSTTSIHQMPIFTLKGNHIVTILDESGNAKTIKFSLSQ